MPRPIRNRKIHRPPSMSGFMPFGFCGKNQERVQLQYDEFESLNLVNYQMLSQEEAAQRMDVSRPTFTRIYNRALQKIAKAMVECLSLEIEGGNVDFDKQWYKCRRCFKLIEGLENHAPCEGCRFAGKGELVKING
ncbi:MAG: DUF134 domain-containing protein [Marinilabiliales bacterium]|nr:DUF134 domain-containing protein [Marinilabiliales bacterium]